VTGSGSGGDRIEIRDLRVVGVHGVLPEERERAQPFSLDIVAWVDMAAAQASDALADTVDYGALAQLASDLVGQGSFQLLEALAAPADRLPAPGGGGGRAQIAATARARCGFHRRHRAPFALTGAHPRERRRRSAASARGV
jgi:hypothetical protein